MLKHAAKIAAQTLAHRVRKAFSAELRAEQVTPDGSEAARTCVEWLRGYIAKPDARLGRKGDICPFVGTALARQRMSFHVYGGVESITGKRLRDVMVDEGLRLLARLDHADDDMELTNVNLLFPRCRAADFPSFHEAHTLSKTALMRRGLMTSVFYPGYTRPGVHNPEFHLYQSPFPIVTIRPMALHDIVFLDRNAYAFAEYRRRYGQKYADGKVPKTHGYIERFADAQQRFGTTHATRR